MIPAYECKLRINNICYILHSIKWKNSFVKRGSKGYFRSWGWSFLIPLVLKYDLCVHLILSYLFKRQKEIERENRDGDYFINSHDIICLG